MLLALKDSPLNSAFVVENLCGEFKHIINYDKTKLKKLGNFYATTWLIFAGPVINLPTYAANSALQTFHNMVVNCVS